MKKENKRILWIVLLIILLRPIIDGFLLYLGIDVTGMIVSLLESTFG